MLFELDNEALSLGRYVRAARFPVIPPEVTLNSYVQLFGESLAQLAFLDNDLEVAILGTFDVMMRNMLCLPASSTHHHRTAGGLFYHSIETAAFAAKLAIEDELSDPMVLACYFAGLLHDLGKSVSLFEVTKLDLAGGDEGFGGIMAGSVCEPRWDPFTTDLWSWCQHHDARYLGLKFNGTPRMGHTTLTAKLWRKFVPEPVSRFVAGDAEALAEMQRYLDRGFSAGPLGKIISVADNQSIQRDVNPERRWQPKRSDLHLVRRFTEFAYLSPWNLSSAPFVHADIWVKGQDSGQTLPFFRASYWSLHRFREYVFAEDRYGCTWPEDFLSTACETLECHGILRRPVPALSTDALEPARQKYNPSFNAMLRYPNEIEENHDVQPLAYFPIGARFVAPGLPIVRAQFL